MDRTKLLTVSLVAVVAAAGSAGVVTAQGEDDGRDGPPPWAGPPSDADHPGHASWLEGQAARAAGAANRDPLAGPPGQIGPDHPGYAGWLEGQEAAARAGDNRDALAGPPFEIGPDHPGYAEWLEGEAARTAGRASRDPLAGPPFVIGPDHPGYAEWLLGQEARAAALARSQAADGDADEG